MSETELYDERAERDLIGIMLVHSHEVEVALLDLDPSDFYDPQARAAFEAIGTLHLEGTDIEIVAVGNVASSRFRDFDRRLLIDWLATDRYIGTIERLTERVRGLSARRRLLADLSQTLNEVREPDSDALALAADLSLRLAALEEGSSGDGFELSRTVDLANRKLEETPWLIPGLMYRRDATVVVAGEGAGKSLLARQIALCAEAGRHPFTRSEIPPIKVLTVDLENKPRAVTESIRKIMAPLQIAVPSFVPECPIWEEPSGIDLMTTRDRQRLIRAVRRTKPDLVILGPLYKALRRPREMTEEQAITEVTQFLDDLRSNHDLGLWLEHHAPHGSNGRRDLRPVGTTIWMRWPEYGKSFEQDTTDRNRLKVRSFRGDRTRVYWPDELIRGKQYGPNQIWPFTGDYGDRIDLKTYGYPHTMVRENTLPV